MKHRKKTKTAVSTNTSNQHRRVPPHDVALVLAPFDQQTEVKPHTAAASRTTPSVAEADTSLLLADVLQSQPQSALFFRFSEPLGAPPEFSLKAIRTRIRFH